MLRVSASVSFRDVADQCICCIVARHVPLIVPPHIRVPRFESLDASIDLSSSSLTVAFISVRNCCITSVISCLTCCWTVTGSGVVSVHESAAAGDAAAAAFGRLSSASTRDVV